jgi:hypothetical protein
MTWQSQSNQVLEPTQEFSEILRNLKVHDCSKEPSTGGQIWSVPLTSQIEESGKVTLKQTQKCIKIVSDIGKSGFDKTTVNIEEWCILGCYAVWLL